MRIILIVLALGTAVIIALTLMATNANKDALRYTGKWKGGFRVESFSGRESSAKDRSRSRLDGYVQVYLTSRKFKLHLEGEQQGIDVSGVWTAKEDRLTLDPKDVQIDDQGGEEKRDPNKRYIPNEAVTTAFRRPIVLVQDKTRKSYQGLLVTIGDLVGRFSFEKDGP